MSTRPVIALAIAAAAATAAHARKLPEYDVLAEAGPAPVRAAAGAGAQGLVRSGSAVQMDSRRGVPKFVWASRRGSAAGIAAANAKAGLFKGSSASAAPAAAGTEAVARAHLATYAGLYGLDAADLDSAVLMHVHDIGRGPIVARFRQTVDGIEVFREEAKVIMDRQRELIALAGHLPSTAASSFAPQISFQLGSAEAVAIAFSDLSGSAIDTSALRSLGALEAGYEALDLSAGLKRTLPGATTQPARAKQVWFHGPDGLQPAYYVEVDSANGTPTSDMYSYVISAVDGTVLFRHDLTEYDAPNPYTYRVWAADPTDPQNPSAPYDGPQGNAFDPHPTGAMDGTQPPGPVPQRDVTLGASRYSADPWLPIGATETTGNNVEAFTDLVAPDGFTPGSADFHADVTGPNAFLRTYDPSLPNDPNQAKAALVQMFYNVNFFHDWYYVSGFTEAAGNGQTNNYGRGGVQGDSLRAEGQDFSGRNNANMATPADGGRPRMQMFLFDGNGPRHLFVTAGAGLAADYGTGIPSGWGISSHDVTGDVVWVNDGVGSSVYPPATTTTTTVHDGCNYTPGAGGVDPRWANVTGKIAFIDRGGSPPAGVPTCGFSDKAFNAQKAGAIGVIIASTIPNQAPAGGVTMGASTTPPPAVTIPAYQLGTADGDAFRNAFASGTVTVRMLRPVTPDRDGTVDNQVMAHEWGHYISNRLIENSAGLTTAMSRGMGEGWADFHALLLTVKEEDAAIASNANYGGVYALSVWVETGSPNGPLANQGAYFGIRRVPYSTDMSKDPLTYAHIQDTAAAPTGAPLASWPAPGTTAANGGNSEVHNTGEVWATMLWECYASILRRTLGPTPALTFNQARERMKDVLVAAYKMTPAQPTFLEARDAVLAAAYATDIVDYRNFWAAFAKRGAGVNAISPDRYSATNNGVVEDFTVPADVTFVGAAIADDVVSCDRDGNLDSGETGHINVTLRNDSASVLSQTTATVTAIGPNAANVTFPQGKTITFASTNPAETATAGVQIALAAGLAGIQPIDLRIDYGDAALPVPVNTVSWSRNGNVDDVAGQAQTETFESTLPVWTTTTVGATFAPVTGWVRNEITAYDHNMKVADQNGTTDLSLLSPAMNVAVGPDLVVTFQHRFSFEFSGTTFFDGGVVEITTDNGGTWTDIGGLATAGQKYTGTLTSGGSPLGPRPAFTAQSAGYPASYVTTTINLGQAYAGKVVRFRFRAGSDSNGRANGWEVDNVALTGVASRPFAALLPNKCAAGVSNRRPVVTAITNPGSVPERTSVTLTVTATDADGDAPLQYFFSQTSGPAVTLSQAGSTSNQVQFTTPDVQVAGATVQIAVVASDGTAFSAIAARNVPVTNVNRAPVTAMADFHANERTLVQLNAAATDADGDPLTYSWTQPAGQGVSLSSTTVANPTFSAPEVPRAGQTFSFTVAVSDGIATTVGTVNVTVDDVNRPPVASASAPQTVNEGDSVVISAAGSTDPDGDPLTYAWTHTGGPAVTLSSATAASPLFTAPQVTTTTLLTFSVTVSDGLVTSAAATTTVTVNNVNQAPIASVSAPLIADERSTLTLDGTASSDPDGTPAGLSYQWTTDGAGTLTTPTQATTGYSTGEVTADTTVHFTLTVTDPGGLTGSQTVAVLVRNVNRAPTANAGATQTVNERTPASLDGSLSSDPDGDALTYRWAQSSGPAVVLSSATAQKPTFTAPDVKHTGDTLTFTLVVCDPSGACSAPAGTTVNVSDVNRKPKAVSGGDVSALKGSIAQLDARLSSDPDGDTLTFQWTQTAGPAVTLTGATGATPTFATPEVVAVLTFSVVAIDELGLASDPVIVNVTVRDTNLPPVAHAGQTLQGIAAGQVVTLDGASTDPEGDALTYSWTQLSGPQVALTGATSPQASFRAPVVKNAETLVFLLTVTDAKGAISSSTYVVQVNSGLPVGGCSIAGGGTAGPLAPIFLLLGLVGLRRRRRA